MDDDLEVGIAAGLDVPTAIVLADDNVATVPPGEHQAIPKKLGLIDAMVILAIIGIIAGQAISSIGGRAGATFRNVANQLGSSTPAATQYNAESKPQAPPKDPIDANADFLKAFEDTRGKIQKIREVYKDRAVTIIGPLDARLKMGFLTDAKSDVLQEYKGEFERLCIEGMTHITAIERDMRHLQVAARRLQRAGASTEDVASAAQDGRLALESIRTRMKLICQLDDEWIVAGQECNRRLQEVGLQ